MTEAFYDLLKASLHGSIVILAVLLLRQLLQKAPRSVFCLLWLLAGLRLVLPFEIESNLSLQPQIPESELSIQAEQPVQVPDILIQNPDGQPLEVPDTPAQTPSLPEGSGDGLQTENLLYGEQAGVITEPISYGDIAAQIWLLGMGIMLAASAVSYWKLKRRVRMAYLIENGCFECPGLETAFVLGFLPPKIYLPAGLTDGEKKFIFDHENTHIARYDHWYKLLGYLVLSLHWFNPLVWVGYGALCRDIELACDEHVVRNMSLTERKAYSAALLSCGGHTARIAACPVAFGESNPKRRILNVLNYKRPSFWISLLAIAAVIFVAVCLLTSPGKPNLLEFGNVADEELHTIGISSEDGLTSVSDPDEIKNIEKLLKSISWEDEAPEEQPDESGGYGILFNSILAEDALYFSTDCSLVWAEGTKAYPVENPKTLREYLDSITDAVWNRETSGEPFADIDQPAKWLRGISESAVREVEIYVEQPTVQEGNSSSTSRSMGVLAARDFDALLDIMNGLPENAIISESTLRRQTFSSLSGSLVPHGGMTLTVYDDVNQLVMMLRLVKNDIMEFILIDELDKVADGVTYLDHPRCWIIEDDTLLAFLNEMQAHPMIITPIEFFGHDTSDVEETQPAWNMDMTEEEFLALCRSAVEELQSREQFHISETIAYFTGETEDSRNYAAYWRDGENWLRESYISAMRTNAEFLFYDGNLYLRRKEDSEEVTWNRIDGGGAGYGDPWLCLLQWDSQTITFEGVAIEGDELRISVIVHATPHTLGWDDVLEYQVLFFFDSMGNLTRAMMSAEQDYTRVISDLTIENTLASNIRSKLESVAAQRPSAPELHQTLTEEQWLEKCRTALENYQSQGSWVILVDNQRSGDAVLTENSSQLWYIHGEDWARQGIISNSDFLQENWYLKKDDHCYSRDSVTIHDPANGDGFVNGWQDFKDISDWPLPWPLEFDWENGEIIDMEARTDGEGAIIHLNIEGSPHSAKNVEQYLVTLWLWPSGELWQAQLEYTETEHTGEKTRVRTTISLNAAAPEEAARMIGQCHNEALLHVHGICNDPDCTDSSHDHSGINCTDEQCTNSTHHHDEHHH